MASDEHKITAPIGVEGIEAEADGDERGLRIVAWAEDAWPDYVAVEDRITGRIRFYGARGGVRREGLPGGSGRPGEGPGRPRRMGGAS